MNQATWTGIITIQFLDGIKHTYNAFQTGVLGVHTINGLTYWYGTVFIDNMYWLDRNIGASSDIAWDNVLGIGEYETGLGTLFTWNQSIAAGVCPKGFRVPLNTNPGREMQYLYSNLTRNTPTEQWGVMTSNSSEEGPKWHYFASTTALKTIPTTSGQTLPIRYRTSNSWLGLDIQYGYLNATYWGSLYDWSGKIRGRDNMWASNEMFVKYSNEDPVGYNKVQYKSGGYLYGVRATPKLSVEAVAQPNMNAHFAVRCVRE